MPYIRHELRYTLDTAVRDPENAAELNFMFCTLINRYLAGQGLNYQKINDVVGAMEGAKAEFYRRVVVPYEDCKLADNGDVFVGRYAT